MLGLRLLTTPLAVFGAELAFMVAADRWASPWLAAWLPLVDALFVTAWTFSVATVLVLLPVMKAWRGHRAELASERVRVQRGIQRQELEGRLRRGLEMARDEGQAVDVMRKGLHTIFAEQEATLLLADSSQAHLELTRMGPQASSAACSVDCPMDCHAARTGRSQRFVDSQAVDACPFLQGSRPVTCAPVSASGRVVGVVQVPGLALEPDDLGKLELVVREFGTRLSVLRAMSAAERAASRDPLTGLLNRRSFEERSAPSLATQDQSAVVMADIDHFKRLNDTYGHAVGDRALTVFARLLHDHFELRGLVARYGGEEFLVLLPGMDVDQAAELTEALRQHVADRCLAAGVPALTASFGVADPAAPGAICKPWCGPPTRPSTSPSARVGTGSRSLGAPRGPNRACAKRADQRPHWTLTGLRQVGTRGPRSGPRPHALPPRSPPAPAGGGRWTRARPPGPAGRGHLERPAGLGRASPPAGCHTDSRR